MGLALRYQPFQDICIYPENYGEGEETGRALGVWCFMPCCLSSLLCQRVVLKAPQPAAAGGPSIHRDAVRRRAYHHSSVAWIRRDASADVQYYDIIGPQIQRTDYWIRNLRQLPRDGRRSSVFSASDRVRV